MAAGPMPEAPIEVTSQPPVEEILDGGEFDEDLVHGHDVDGEDEVDDGEEEVFASSSCGAGAGSGDRSDAECVHHSCFGTRLTEMRPTGCAKWHVAFVHEVPYLHA